MTSPLFWGGHVTLSQSSPKGLSWPICKMGKSDLVTHNLGFSPWLMGGKLESWEILKVHEVVEELFSVLPATPQGAQLSPCTLSAPKLGRGPGVPGSWLSWDLALDSVASSLNASLHSPRPELVWGRPCLMRARG